MDTDDNLVEPTALVVENVDVLTYPNEATEIVCSIIEEVCPNLDFVQLPVFRTSVRTHLEKHRGDGLIFRFLLSSFNAVDWEFVGEQLKERQNVDN